MRKIFTLLFAVVTALAAQATDYDVPMSITINDDTSEQRTVISITENEGLYELVNGYGEVMKVVTGLNEEFIEFLTKLIKGELA